MSNQETFGRIINGKLVMAPKVIYTRESQIFNPPESELRELGYKRVIFSDALPAEAGKVLRYRYEDEGETIVQKYYYESIDLDPTAIYSRAYRETLSQIRQISESIDAVIAFEHRLASEWKLKMPYLKDLFGFLREDYPASSVKELYSFVFYEEKGCLKFTEYAQDLFSKAEVYEFISSRGITPFFFTAPLAHLHEAILRYEAVQYKMIFCYLHTVLDDYLGKVIRLIISLYPKGASLEIKLTQEDIFGCNSVDELRTKVIDSKIGSLGYGNYQAKMEFIANRGVKPNLDRTEYWDDIILLCEQRNILVHNAGVVNNQFIEKTLKTAHKGKYYLGQSIEFNHEIVSEAFSKVSALCSGLNDALKEKFHF